MKTNGEAHPVSSSKTNKRAEEQRNEAERKVFFRAAAQLAVRTVYAAFAFDPDYRQRWMEVGRDHEEFRELDAIHASNDVRRWIGGNFDCNGLIREAISAELEDLFHDWEVRQTGVTAKDDPCAPICPPLDPKP